MGCGSEMKERAGWREFGSLINKRNDQRVMVMRRKNIGRGEVWGGRSCVL